MTVYQRAFRQSHNYLISTIYWIVAISLVIFFMLVGSRTIVLQPRSAWAVTNGTADDMILNKPDLTEIEIDAAWHLPIELPSPVNLYGWEDSLSVDPNDGFKIFFTYTPIDVSSYQQDLTWEYTESNPNPTYPDPQQFKEKYIIGPERSANTGALNTDIFMATMTGQNVWEVQELPSPINENGQTSVSEEYAPSISSDGKSLYFVKSNIGVYQDIYVSKTNISSNSWSNPVPVTGLNHSDPRVDDDNPNIGNNGEVLFFDSDRPGGQGARDIYYSLRSGDGWDEPKALSAINSSNTDWQPFLTNNGRELYFTSNRTQDEQTIYKSERLGSSWDEWSEPQPVVSTLGSAKILGVGEPSLSTDRSKLYFIYAYLRNDGQIETNAVVAVNRTLPPASIVSPRTNEVVAGPLIVKAIATDPKSVSQIEFYIDDDLNLSEVDADENNNYYYVVNTDYLSNGLHRVNMIVTDIFGNKYEAGTSVEVVGAQVSQAALDNTAPKVSLRSPLVSTRASKTTAFKVSWKGSDSGSGIATYDVRYKVGKRGGWRNWKTNISKKATRFKGRQGNTYYFKARARDRAGNVGRWSKPSMTMVPYDNNRLIRKRVGFRPTSKHSRSMYYRGTARYSTVGGDTITYRFKGNKVALISTKARNRSKARIYIDGKYKRTVNTYSKKTKHRRVIYSQTFKRHARHTITIVNIGNRRRLDIDALAVGR